MTKTTISALIEQFMLANPSITQHRTIAKLLYGNYPMVFKSVDNARDMVRYCIGQHGEKNRKHTHHDDLVQKLEAARAKIAPMVPSKIDMTPYTVKKYEKILIISDLHGSLVDLKSLLLALEYGYNKGAEAIIINGDLMDFATVSRFISHPDNMTVHEEVELVNNILDTIQELMDIPIIYHAGNHCVRLDHYILMKSPELFGITGITLNEQLRLKERNIDFVEDYRYMKYGNLNIAHGHHIVKGVFAPVNSARGAFNKTGTSTLISHVHRTSEHIEPNMNDKVIGCYSIGCLTDIHPMYNPQTGKFNQGFAMVELLDDEGDFTVDNRKIIDHKIR